MLRKLYEFLLDEVEESPWWPSESDFEIVVGAILTQNTNWRNVEKSLSNLKNEKLLTPEQIIRLENSKLCELIKPSGFYTRKSIYLKNISKWYLTNANKDLDSKTLRKSLLNVTGVGYETADDILLYVFNKPVFIYDLYARDILKILGFDYPNKYEVYKRIIDPLLNEENFNVNELKRFHGVIVDFCKEYKKERRKEKISRLKNQISKNV